MGNACCVTKKPTEPKKKSNEINENDALLQSQQD